MWANAGWLADAGFYKNKAVGGTPPTLVFQSQTALTYIAGSTQTATAVAIGSASANRRVIVVVLEQRSTNAITDISVGGTSVGANLYVYQNPSGFSYDGQVAYGWIDVASGTTANIVITGGGTNGDETGADIYVYTVDKTTLNDTNPVISTPSTAGAGSTVTTLTDTVNTQSNGFIIASLTTQFTAGTTGLSITSSTETYTTAGTPTNHTMSSYKASGAAANTPTSVTWSWTTAGGGVASIFTWR